MYDTIKQSAQYYFNGKHWDSMSEDERNKFYASTETFPEVTKDQISEYISEKHWHLTFNDVAHLYYLGIDRTNPLKHTTKAGHEGILSSWDLDHPSFNATNEKPYLYHLKDLTEEHARILYELFYGEEFDESIATDVRHGMEKPLYNTALEWWKYRAKNNYPTECFAMGVPRVWFMLLKLRYDLFDLIDNGYAIDINKMNSASEPVISNVATM